MRAGKHIFIVALLVLVAGLVNGSQAHVFHGSRERHCSKGIVQHVPVLAISQLTEGRSSDPTTRHGEKRHGKSLVSEAIVADGPMVVRPWFTYGRRNYSLFLPAGCSHQFTGNFSLRGPPCA